MQNRHEELYKFTAEKWPFIHLLASSIYFCFGIIHCYCISDFTLIKYYIIGSIFHAILLLPLLLVQKKYPHKKMKIIEYFHPSLISILLITTMSVSYYSKDANSSLIFNLILNLGILSCVWYLRPFSAVLNAFMCSLDVILFSIILGPQLEGKIIIISLAFFPLLLWQTAMYLANLKSTQRQIQIHKLKTYHATIVSLQHEFRNVATLIAGNFLKKKRKETETAEDQELSAHLDRLLLLIDQVESLKELEEVKYASKEKMIKLNQ